jgi:uncharacterized protein YkwD
MKQKIKKSKMSTKSKKLNSVPVHKHRPSVTHLMLRSSVFAFLGFTLLLNIYGISSGSPKGAVSSNGEVLAYATNTTITGLLTATNAERVANGLPALTLNSKLNSSAQSKANDMVATNYWAHNRPDGSLPWNFFYAAGYTGSNLGENLAYGQLTSQQTVNEWMASPTHRANILNTSFCEVGFGMANSANFVTNGPQTIVSAHYGRPFGVCPGEVVSTITQINPTSTKGEDITIQTPDDTNSLVTTKPDPAPSIQTSAPEVTQNGRRASRIELYTKGKAPWLDYVISLGLFVSLGAYALKHAIGLKKTLLSGESWVLHHPTIDAAILSLIALTFFLSRSIGGFIK